MANGDIAAGIGLAVVPGTSDLRMGYDEINKTRDMLATHMTVGTHSADAITTGVLALARIPNLDLAHIPNMDKAHVVSAGLTMDDVPGSINPLQRGISASNLPSSAGSTQNDLNGIFARLGAPWPNSVDTPGSISSLFTYNNTLGGSRRAVWVNNAGVFGVTDSSNRFKDVTGLSEADPLAVLGLTPVVYTLKAETEARDRARAAHKKLPPVHSNFGLIAEELAAAGLWEVVYWDDDGKTPRGIHYDMFSVLVLIATQHVWAEHLVLADKHDRLVDFTVQLAATVNDLTGESE